MVDATSKKLKNIELKNPLRIKVTKSPVLINFKLYQVGVSCYLDEEMIHSTIAVIILQYVSNWPREEVKNTHHGKKFRCKDIWYTSSDDVNCGFVKTKEGEKIFDSQVLALGCGRNF